MSKTPRRWLFGGLRLLICGAALAWVVNNLTYYDYVTLTDGSRLRALRIAERTVTVIGTDGLERNIDADRIMGDEAGDREIEYGLGTTLREADTSTLMLCLLIYAPVTLIQSLRFQWMLRAQDIRVSYWESVKLTYAGNFLNFVAALGNTGGDVFKMYYVSLHTERKTEAVTTVLLDRVVGLYGLILLVAAVILFRADDPKLSVLRYGVGVAALGGMIAAVVLFSERARSLLKTEHLLAKLPFATHLQRAEAATRRLAHHKRLVGGALACTVTLQVIALTSFVLAAKALDMRFDGGAIWDYYAYLASGVVVAAIPISFQGLGTMEAFYKHVFLDTHGTLAALLCLAMAVRLINLFWSLPGVIVTITGSYRPRIAEREVNLAQCRP